jgi:hypothetical protein
LLLPVTPALTVRALFVRIGHGRRRGNMGGMYVLGGSRSSSGKRAGPTIYEMNAPPEGRSGREMLRLVGAGPAITWRAGAA